MAEGVVGPSGTVTFLFTDIEGSTRRWESDPEAMRSALAAHDDVLGSVIEAHGGHLLLWPVPSLDIAGGADSAAAESFVERARAVKPDFDQGAAIEAVAEICRRVDGIALAIELAAARTLSMTAQDVCDHLDDRFRLLSGSRRGLERHQTLRNTIQWSYDLLDDDERQVLGSCSVFAGGFDLAAAAHLCGGLDEYAVLDRLDSLVRKSLVTTDPVNGHARYGLLETVRQFAEEQLAATGAITSVRDIHARYFADRILAHWELSDGPQQRVALDWVDVEFANLRVGFRWAAERGDLDTATAIAAHTTMLGIRLLRYEPLTWTEEILDAAVAADVGQLPRIYTAASLCSQIGDPEAAVDYSRMAVELGADPRYDPFDPGVAGDWEIAALVYCGRMEEALEISTDLAAQVGLAHVVGSSFTLLLLPVLGRGDEARAMADETLAAARTRANPWWVAAALGGYGCAFADTDPDRAPQDHARSARLQRPAPPAVWNALLSREVARLEATHGDRGQALDLFESAVDSMHRAGDVSNLAATFAALAVLFDRMEQPAPAAILYGVIGRHGNVRWVVQLPAVVAHLRAVLRQDASDACVATGAAMDLSAATQYAQDEIRLARRQFAEPTSRDVLPDGQLRPVA